MIKKFLLLFNSILLLSSAFSMCSSAPAMHPDFLPPKPLTNKSKKEFINFLYLIQDYNIHAKNLILILEKNQSQIKEELKQEAEDYKKTIETVSELDEKSESYQEKLIYIKKEANNLKPLAELKKEENSLNLNKIIHLMEALYLLSTTEKEKTDNHELGKRKLSLQFHPDRCLKPEEINDKDSIKHTVYTEISRAINSLLISDEPNDGLHKLQTQKQNIIIPEPSPFKQNVTGFATLITSIATQNIGYETITRMMPNRIEEAQLYQQCIGSLAGTTLVLQKKMMDLHSNQ